MSENIREELKRITDEVREKYNLTRTIFYKQKLAGWLKDRCIAEAKKGYYKCYIECSEIPIYPGDEYLDEDIVITVMRNMLPGVTVYAPPFGFSARKFKDVKCFSLDWSSTD